MAKKPLSKAQKIQRAKNNKAYKQSQAEKGLCCVPVWCPINCKDELRELMAIICEFYTEKGEFHKDLFPAMYRDFNTGVMGNKSLNEVKKSAKKG